MVTNDWCITVTKYDTNKIRDRSTQKYMLMMLATPIHEFLVVKHVNQLSITVLLDQFSV